MLLTTVHSIFAFIFLSFAFTALRWSQPLLLTGWYTIQAAVQHPDYRHDVESRQAISSGGRFLIGGIFWLVAGLVSGGIGLSFGWQVVRLWLA